MALRTHTLPWLFFLVGAVVAANILWPRSGFDAEAVRRYIIVLCWSRGGCQHSVYSYRAVEAARTFEAFGFRAVPWRQRAFLNFDYFR